MDKPHPPTKSRIRRALAEGDVPMSFTATRTAALLGLLVVAPALARAMATRFRDLLETAMTAPESASATSVPFEVLTLAGPALGIACGMALLSGIAQTGGRFRRARPSSENTKLGARTHDGLGRAALACCVLFGLSAALAVALGASARDLRDAALSPTSVASTIGSVLAHVAWALACLLAVATLADLAVARLSWLARLRMSRAELLEERRQTEGSPELRRARRRAYEALVRDQ